MPLSPEEQLELDQLELAELEEQEAAEQAKAAAPEQSFVENFAESIPIAAKEGVRKIGNVFTHEPPENRLRSRLLRNRERNTPEFFSDENVQRGIDENKELMGTWGGILGGGLAETAITAPFTAGTSLGLTTARRVAPIARKIPIVGRAASGLVNAATGRVAKSGAEGAVAGGLMAGPDDRTEEAGVGAVTSAGLHTLGRFGGRVARGVVEKSKEAKDLAHIAMQQGKDFFLPLSKAVRTGDDASILDKAMRIYYKDIMPFTPFAGENLENQGERALVAAREIAMKEAAAGKYVIPKGAGEEVARHIPDLKKALADEYEQSIKSIDFTASSLSPIDVRQNLLKIPRENMDRDSIYQAAKFYTNLFDRYEHRGMISGHNALEMKKSLDKAIAGASGNYKAALENMRDTMDAKLKWKMDIQQVGNRYRDIAEPERALSAVEKAAYAARAKEGNFSMEQLAKETGKLPPGTTVDRFAQSANRVLKPEAPHFLAGRGLEGAVRKVVGAGAIGLGPLTAVPATLLAGNIGMSSRYAQEMLMGDRAWQKAVAEALRKHQKALKHGGSAVRRFGAIEAGDDDGSNR